MFDRQTGGERWLLTYSYAGQSKINAAQLPRPIKTCTLCGSNDPLAQT